jgi:capsular polysaccharide biosynthesis protein
MNASDHPASEPSVREQLLAISDFFRRALRFWHVVVVALLLGATAFGLFYYLRQPRFRSETVVLYVQKGGPDENADTAETQRSVTLRLKELLVSRPSLERIISRFDLYPALRQRYGMVDAIEELKKHIDFRAPGGDTFSIAFEGVSAKEAQAVTAELARQVLEGDAKLRKEQAKVALDFLIGERKARDAELREAEEKLAAFMAQHPRFALDATPLANGAAIRASMGAAVAAKGGAAGSAWAPPRGPGVPNASAPTISAPGSAPSTPHAPSADEARARAALAAARESLTEKLAHYTPAHPDVRAAEGEVQRASERLAALASAAPKASPSENASAQPSPAPSAAPRPVAAPARVAISTPPKPESSQNLVDLEIEWLKLTRAVTEARQRQDQIEGQLFRADIQASSETGGHGVQVNVIDPAFLPQTPLPPGRTTLALIFLAASLVLGAIGALILAIFDERLFTSRDLAAVSQVLTEVPKRGDRRAYVAG